MIFANIQLNRLTVNRQLPFTFDRIRNVLCVPVFNFFKPVWAGHY